GYCTTENRRGLRIATKYPTLTGQFLRRHGITHCKIVSPHGALEAAPLTDTADLIVDLTETGTTLRENHLKLLDDGVVLQSQSCMIANARLLREDQQALQATEMMLELIDARTQARNQSMLIAYVRSENLEAIQRLCARLNQRLKLGDTGAGTRTGPGGIGAEFRVSPAEIPGGTGALGTDWYTISGVAGGLPPQLLELVAALRSVGAQHIDITPLTYCFSNESASVRALRERLKRHK